MSKHWNKNTYLLFLLNLFIRTLRRYRKYHVWRHKHSSKKEGEVGMETLGLWRHAWHCPYLRYLYYFCIFTDQHFYYIWFRKKNILDLQKNLLFKGILESVDEIQLQWFMLIIWHQTKVVMDYILSCFSNVKEINFVFVLA